MGDWGREMAVSLRLAQAYLRKTDNKKKNPEPTRQIIIIWAGGVRLGSRQGTRALTKERASLR